MKIQHNFKSLARTAFIPVPPDPRPRFIDRPVVDPAPHEADSAAPQQNVPLEQNEQLQEHTPPQQEEPLQQFVSTLAEAPSLPPSTAASGDAEIAPGWDDDRDYDYTARPQARTPEQPNDKAATASGDEIAEPLPPATAFVSDTSAAAISADTASVVTHEMPEPETPEAPATLVATEEAAPEPPPIATIAAIELADETPPPAPRRAVVLDKPMPRAKAQTNVTIIQERIRLARVLLTNDDGIDAAGMTVLAGIAAELADEVWIIAPEHDQSGTAMSLALHHPRRVYQRGYRRYAVSGSPADCVALATHLMRDNRPQLLLSGINNGQNAGDDANLSGTLGAALTGLMLKIPSIAISQAYRGERGAIDWATARAHLPHLLQALLHQGWRKDTCLSINIPALPPEDVTEAVWTRQAPRTITNFNVEQRTDLRGLDYFWINLSRPDHIVAGDDTDIAALQRGQISISCVALDRSRDVQNEAIGLSPEL